MTFQMYKNFLFLRKEHKFVESVKLCSPYLLFLGLVLHSRLRQKATSAPQVYSLVSDEVFKFFTNLAKITQMICRTNTLPTHPKGWGVHKKTKSMENMIKVTVIDHEGTKHELDAPTDMNMNMMELCKSYALPVEGTCGGMALCASCHLYVESEHETGEPSEAEEDMLDQAFFVEDNSRLGCQIRLANNLDRLVVRLAPVNK